LTAHDLHTQLATIAEPAKLLEEIFAHAPVALQIFERSGRCLLVNAAHTELFGGVPPAEYNIFEDTLVAEAGLVELIKRAFAGERITTPTIWYDIRELRNIPSETTMGGKRIAIGAELMPLRDGTGDVAYVLLVFNDQTAASVAREEAEAAARNAERARAAAESRAHHSTFLANAARLLSASLDLDITLSQVARLATSALADFCIVDLVNADGSYRRVAAVHADPAEQPLLDELRTHYAAEPGSPHPAARVIKTGEPDLIEEIDSPYLLSHVMSPEHAALVKRIGLRSHLAFPLQVGERTVGAISLGYTGSGRYSEDDLPLVQALASHAAVAIENARLFRAAEEARRDAESANRAKDEFLAMLGHELRNPLAPIVTALELTRERDGASRERTIIERQVDHLRRLVDDLLDISRITRGALELEERPVELADAIAEAYELARPLIEQRRHQASVDVPRGMIVLGDRVRLAQIFANLLTNAARYTEPGGTISIAGESRKGMHSIRVRDTGVGMTAELAKTVFETFARGSRPIDRASGGLGLGLAIVKALALRHGGHVSARSDGPNRGSEFTVTLPAYGGEQRKRATTQMPAMNAPSDEGLVLIVDDNLDAALLLSEALEGHGYKTVTASHPLEALDVAKNHVPTIALVDLGLPVMDGFELGRRLLVDHPKLKLVALTGYGQRSDRERTAAAGFTEHLVKPIKLAVLTALLERLLRDA
jgi:signal transduction histidine kinase/ActR/RegA family two-component response regulator